MQDVLGQARSLARDIEGIRNPVFLQECIKLGEPDISQLRTRRLHRCDREPLVERCELHRLGAHRDGLARAVAGRHSDLSRSQIVEDFELPTMEIIADALQSIIQVKGIANPKPLNLQLCKPRLQGHG